MSKLWTRLGRRTAFSFAATRARVVPHPNKRVNRTVQSLRCWVPSALRASAAGYAHR